VLELAADRPGAFAAKLLGDLGADVIKIEPPGGDPLRAQGPFWRDAVHPDRSLGFWFYNTSKRSVVLDLTHPDGRAAALGLAAGADVVIHSGEAGALERLGLGYDALRRTNPGVVVACITPFGETGPRRGWRTSGIVAEAVSGMLYVNGFPGAPPLATAGTQAYHATGAHAAIAVLAALIARERDGSGQRIDVSVQEASAAAVEHVASLFRQTGRVYRRAGSLHWTRYFRAARCRDGYVLHSSLGDWTSLLAWVQADGREQDLGDPQWEDLNHRRRHCEHLFDVLDVWVRDRDVAELMAGAQLRRIPYAAVRPPEELPADPHLVARGFFVPVRHPELGTAVRHPGAPYRFGATPWAIRRRPPLLGEHTDQILGSAAAAAGSSGGTGDAAVAGRRHDTTPALRPLDGVRVLDFTWVVAGPTATRLFADLGAEVIKIERGDALDFGDRRGGFTGSLNRGKLGIVLNLADPRGLDIARRLVATADVVIDNFSARVMANWGLDYAGLRAIRPDVIAVSMSGFGQTGPYRDYVSYGPTLQALAGYTSLMRHPDGEPAGFGFSYADIVGGVTAALAVLAALWHRRQSGEGQMIDLSQFEAVCAMLGPLLLEITANGRRIAPLGNASQEGPAAPHGVYRCAGEDRWCAIAVLDQDEWRRFARALGSPTWCRDPRFARPADRVRNRAALDEMVEAWTSVRSAEEVTERLQAAGIRAGVVASAEDLCLGDPQLKARGYWMSVDTPEGTPACLDGIPYRLERTPARVSGPGPLLGEHTDDVLGRLLGFRDSEIAALRAGGVVA
jgi:crotonobetainyl-CoA:carnitine CoA-transferase CaiB-like acyl-CoA transferase